MKRDGTAFERIYSVVRKIPPGCVATYGQIALLAGNPRWSRTVGFALHVNPDPVGTPCYRVVNRFGECSGSFAFGGEGIQRGMLEKDGVTFDAYGRVEMVKYIWHPQEGQNR